MEEKIESKCIKCGKSPVVSGIDDNKFCLSCSMELFGNKKEKFQYLGHNPPELENLKEIKFITKDSGKREEFPSGARRDTQEGKTRYDLIPITALTRLADLYARGAVKYDEFNWRGGIPYSRCYSSLLRHLFQWVRGDKDEDHLAAVAFGIFSLLHYEETNRTDLDDMEKYRK